MTTRIAINGMGRIGRLLFRRLMKDPDIRIVAVNDLMDGANCAYLLRHDSIYGNSPLRLDFKEGALHGAGTPIPYLQEPDPAKLPWNDLGVDLVLECTGRFTTRQKAEQHLAAGAGRVLLSTTGSDDVPLYIYGHNQQGLRAADTLLSPGGCMTNCATNLIAIMEGLGIESVQIHMVHSYTSRQELVDGPNADFRRGRAAAESIIPVPIDLDHALLRLFPHLQGRVASVSTRVPVANGALGDFTFLMKEETSAAAVNAHLRAAANSMHEGIVGYTEEPLVSLDVKGDPHSALVDGTLTSAAGRLVKLFAFFDNEYGYTSRVIDWIRYWRLL
ncbi:type I glyceraldehyde-3-phosphate dehydrogenase [Flaviaesturariibacter amylovorans]|uniref:Type I glyceraldehyde-3-phosphate dehydrogenase n=1 Tax=Flaviaesturariibacter amylovorans TaxID=1084520 RepID=A0ABP8HKW8_9BACT